MPHHTIHDDNSPKNKKLQSFYTLKALRPDLHDNKYAAITIYSDKFKFVSVRISLDSEHLHSRHAKENQTPITLFYCWKFIQVNAITL